MERFNIPHPDISEITAFETPRLTAMGAAHDIAKDISHTPSLALTAATGNTMIYLTDELPKTGVNFSKIMLRHLDEYVDCSVNDEESFVKYIRDKYVIPLGVDLRNVDYINGKAENPSDEAKRYDLIVTKRKSDVTILGSGPKTHFGFTESSPDPAVFELRTHLQKLSNETVERDLKRGQPRHEHAITQGPQNIAETVDHIVWIAYGAEKGRELGIALYGPITPKYIGSYLRTKGVGCKVSLYIDKEAAEQINLMRLKFERAILK